MNKTKPTLSSPSRRAILGAAAITLTPTLVRAASMESATPEIPVGPPQGLAMLSRNENPYGPSPLAVRAGEEAVRAGAYYADRSLLYLVDMIVERHGVSRDFISVSAGSGEGLCAAAQFLTRGGKTILAPDLFWDTTVRYAERQGAKVLTVPLQSDLEIDLDEMENRVNRNVKVVHITNPNNPTGMLLDPAALRAFIRRVEKKATVIVDEAYMELTDNPESASMVDLVREELNVVVSRTFSKIYGMAGLRVGYLLARPDLTAPIRSNIMSWISGPGLAAAVASYNDMAFLKASKAKIIEGREMVIESARAMGLSSKPSQTNFVYLDTNQDANSVQSAMADNDISIRGAYRGYPTWSRVSMGRLEDVARFTQTLPKVLGR